MDKVTYKTVDEYIGAQRKELRPILNLLRKCIRETAPAAEEVISYNMPAYKYHGILVYFALHQHHVGFYPTASGIAMFKHEFHKYKHAKGSVQFPTNEALPIELIQRIIQFKLAENLEKELLKKTKNKSNPKPLK